MKTLQHSFIRIICIMVVSLGIVESANASEKLVKDPLNSVMWGFVAKEHLLSDPLSNGQIVVSDDIIVKAPKTAENQFQVPVQVSAAGLSDVVKIVVITDLNPITHVLNYYPDQAKPSISFRIKLQQGSPVRAAALTKDGVWHMNGVYVDAAGGGCSAPATAHNAPDWTAGLGNVKGKVWRSAVGKKFSKMRFNIKHPMDTGLADGIPALYLEKLTIENMQGKRIARVEMFEPVSENPALTIAPLLAGETNRLVITGRDNGGNKVSSSLPVPVRSSYLYR